MSSNQDYKKARKAVGKLTFNEWRQLKSEIDKIQDERHGYLFKAAWELTGAMKINDPSAS